MKKIGSAVILIFCLSLASCAPKKEIKPTKPDLTPEQCRIKKMMVMPASASVIRRDIKGTFDVPELGRDLGFLLDKAMAGVIAQNGFSVVDGGLSEQELASDPDLKAELAAFKAKADDVHNGRYVRFGSDQSLVVTEKGVEGGSCSMGPDVAAFSDVAGADAVMYIHAAGGVASEGRQALGIASGVLTNVMTTYNDILMWEGLLFDGRTGALLMAVHGNVSLDGFVAASAQPGKPKYQENLDELYPKLFKNLDASVRQGLRLEPEKTN